MYFDHAPPIPTHLLTHPIPCSISLSLSLNIKNFQTNSPKKLKIETKKTNRATTTTKSSDKVKQKAHRETMAYVLCLGPTLRVANIPDDPPLEERDFLFSIGYQLQITSWLGVGAHVHSLLLKL